MAAARDNSADAAGAADEPLTWVEEHLALVRRGGRVLDVATGSGRHLRRALTLGYHVTGIDRDLGRVRELSARTDVELIAADLETGSPPPFDGQRFDGVIVTNYLWRPLLPAIVAAVADDGVLIYETFAVGQERYGRPTRPDFLLRPGELIEAVRGRLVVLGYRHGRRDGATPAVRQGIVAVGARHDALT